MRRNDRAGRDLPPDAYVFGDALGRRVKSVHEAWTNARNAADLGDFQLRDLRHEAASRFDEAGVSIVYVSSMLGHSNLSTTSRYLNIHRRGLHLAMQKLEESRTPASKRTQENAPTDADSLHNCCTRRIRPHKPSCRTRSPQDSRNGLSNNDLAVGAEAGI
jgi:hypothetical protein